MSTDGATMLLAFLSFAFSSPLSDALRTYDCPTAIDHSMPADFHMRMGIGYCHAKQNQHETALQFYQDPPEGLRPFAALLEAESRFALSQYQAAAKQLSVAVKGERTTLLRAKILC